jgi:UDP-N-acetylmuramate dehydrogenase
MEICANLIFLLQTVDIYNRINNKYSFHLRQEANSLLSLIQTMIIQENISLKAYNTFGLDIIAKKFAEIKDQKDIETLIRDNAFSSQDFLILGGGSNILFTDDFEGLVVKNNISGIEVRQTENNDKVLVTAGAGVVWNDFVQYCVERNYGGIENLSLIPGCVGASPIQNIGAYGVELKDCFHSLQAIDIATARIMTYYQDDCKFGYRDSIFKKELKGKVIILSVTLLLKKDAIPDISYGAIRQELAAMGVSGTADIQSVGKAVSSIREKKLPDPEDLGNAGSFFKNPVILQDAFNTLLKDYPTLPSYEAGPGKVKVPAGWLIEHCGWKGRKIGNAGVHEKQALVIVNHGNARGREIFELATAIKTSVADKFGIFLEMEVNVV